MERDAEFSVIRLESEIRLRAPREKVFRAMTEESGKWFPYTYGGERVRSIVFEPRVGGTTYEDWGDGAGHFYSTITHWDPPAQVSMRGFLSGTVQLSQGFVLEEDGSETVLKHSTVAYGEISDAEAEGIEFHGSVKRFEENIRAWVERGEETRLEPAG